MSQGFGHKRVPAEILQAIGYVAVVAGTIEHYLEDIILNITKENVAGIYPSTDLVAVRKLIDRFDGLANDISSASIREAVKTWCEAARHGFVCRNSILHGLSIVWNDESLSFITNTRYRQELRKLKSQSFIADNHTTRLLAQAFETLSDAITGFMFLFGGKLCEDDLFRKVSIADIQAARSTTRELANLIELCNNEKY